MEVSTKDIRACGYCKQEMECMNGIVPLHLDYGTLCPGGDCEGNPPSGGPSIRKPLLISEIGPDQVREALDDERCWSCGLFKTVGRPLCRSCYLTVPSAWREFLRHVKDAGFVGAFQAALGCLNEERKKAFSVAAATDDGRPSDNRY